jgi:hypothetical protein
MKELVFNYSKITMFSWFREPDLGDGGSRKVIGNHLILDGEPQLFARSLKKQASKKELIMKYVMKILLDTGAHVFIGLGDLFRIENLS